MRTTANQSTGPGFHDRRCTELGPVYKYMGGTEEVTGHTTKGRSVLFPRPCLPCVVSIRPVNDGRGGGVLLRGMGTATNEKGDGAM